MLRIGEGFDVHRFMPSKDGCTEVATQGAQKLVLGGVSFEESLPLKGHSDADVVLHALMDALLGAANIEGAADIGELFPDNDAAYKDISSRELLRRVNSLLLEHECTIQNIDITVIAQTPKISPQREAMAKTIADDLQISKQAVSVKATTTEGLGFLGRKEGIAASAICLLDKS